MKKYRLFLLGLVAAVLVLLSGNVFPAEKQQTSSNAKRNQTKTQQRFTSPKKTALRVNDDAELQKTLDLSIPFKEPENTGLTVEQDSLVQGELSNMFAADQKKKPRPLYLDGQMLMSPEPEVDKRKSLDGAGIVINLKR